MIRTVERCRHCGSLESDDIAIDAHGPSLVYAGRSVHLTPTEVSMIAALMEAGGALVRHDRLIHRVWGHRDDGGPETAENILKVRIVCLRKKLRQIAAPVEIVNRHGVGYYLERRTALATRPREVEAWPA